MTTILTGNLFGQTAEEFYVTKILISRTENLLTAMGDVDIELDGMVYRERFASLEKRMRRRNQEECDQKK